VDKQNNRKKRRARGEGVTSYRVTSSLTLTDEALDRQNEVKHRQTSHSQNAYYQQDASGYAYQQGFEGAEQQGYDPSQQGTYDQQAYDQSQQGTYDQQAYDQSQQGTYDQQAYDPSQQGTYDQQAYDPSQQGTYDQQAYDQSQQGYYDQQAYDQSQQGYYDQQAYDQSQQGYYDQQGYDQSQQGYYDQQAYDQSQQGYYDQQAYDQSQQGYYDQQGYDQSQQGYYDQQGYDQSQQGYYDQQGYDQSQQGYYDQQGYDQSQQGYYDQQGYDQSQQAYYDQQAYDQSQQAYYDQQAYEQSQQGYYDPQSYDPNQPGYNPYDAPPPTTRPKRKPKTAEEYYRQMLGEGQVFATDSEESPYADLPQQLQPIHPSGIPQNLIPRNSLLDLLGPLAKYIRLGVEKFQFLSQKLTYYTDMVLEVQEHVQKELKEAFGLAFKGLLDQLRQKSPVALPYGQQAGQMPPGSMPVGGQAPPPPPQQHPPVSFVDLHELNVDFTDNYDQPLFDFARYANSRYTVSKMIVDPQATEMALYAIRECAPRANAIPPATEGPFANIPLSEVMMASGENELQAFLRYVKAYPGNYVARSLKVSETFATWVVYGAPQP